MAQHTFRYQIEGTVTVDENDLRTAHLGWLSQFAPEHDDPESQAEQFAMMATTPLDHILVGTLLRSTQATQEAILGALPEGSSCPTPQVSILH